MYEMKVVLGSASPRRRELLSELVSDYIVRPSGADEACTLSLPHQRAMFTAGRKAAAIAIEEGELLLCADTIVWCEGRFLGKPQDSADAKSMLAFLNRRTNVVYTGVCLRTTDSWDFFCAQSGVQIDMTEQELDAYVTSGCPMDKAGAYGIQDPLLHAKLLYGSMSNVIGLPVEQLQRHLQSYGL